jgi:hypothetical protein
MKKLSLSDLQKAKERGLSVVDKDGIEVRLPKPEPKPDPKPEPAPPPKDHQAEIAAVVDRMAEAVMAMVKANQLTAENIAALASAMKVEPAKPVKPRSWSFDVEYDERGRTKTINATPKM